MDVIEIMNQLLPILPIALAIALVIIGILYVCYAFYKRRGGNRKITISQVVTLFILVGWFAVVLGLTTLSRGAFFDNYINLRLFSDYVNAWHQWSLSEMQLIIFNMLMFAPLGFLLPILSKKIRSFRTVFCISLIVTLGIELIQLFTNRGIFELNDILHNTIGSIAGYFLVSAILDSIKLRKITVKAVFMALCIPLFFALLFSSALIVYHSKELGNLSIRPAVPQIMKQVDVQLNKQLPTNADSVSLYYNNQIHNLKYGEEMAALMESSFNLKQKGRMRIEGFNRSWTYMDADDNEYIFNYGLSDGGWQFYRKNHELHSMEQDDLEKHGTHYENWMLSNNILSTDAIFTVQNEETIRWDIEQDTKNILHKQADFSEGFVILNPSKERQIPLDLFYSMNESVYLHQVNIISPAEAYENILKGKFTIYNNLVAGDQLNVTEYELAYMYDSKGYYQPVYRFIGLLNGEDWEVLVPAID